MKKIILTLALLTALVFPSGVLADAYSQGEVDYNISIDKKFMTTLAKIKRFLSMMMSSTIE